MNNKIPTLNLTIRSQSSKETVIDIDGTIGEDFWSSTNNTAKNIKNQLNQLEAIETELITVNINSLGGDISEGLAIHDVLASHSAEVVTVVSGRTASAATIIAQAGDIRRMSVNALYLIHKSWGLFMGNENALETALEDVKKADDTQASLYARRSGRPESEIRDLMNANNGRGSWLSSEEALEAGLIDEEYEPSSALAACVIDQQIMALVPEHPDLQSEVEEETGDVIDEIEKDDDEEIGEKAQKGQLQIAKNQRKLNEASV